MRKVSEILTIARRYHGASHGLTHEQTGRHPTMYWGLCLALRYAHFIQYEITRDELFAALGHIRDYVTGGCGTYLSDVLNTRCPQVISAWWDNHINDLREKGL